MRRTALAIMAGIFVGLIVSWLLLSFDSHAVFPFTEINHIEEILGLGFIVLFFSFGLLQQRHKEKIKIQILKNQKQEIETKLKEQQRVFESLFHGTNMGILLSGVDGRILQVNQSVCHLLGYEENDLLTMNFYYLIHPNELNSLQVHIQKLINKELTRYHSEQQCFRKNGEMVWVMSSLSLIRDEHDQPLYFIVQVENITLQKNAEDRLRHMAYHDPLTGLANRNKLEQFINHILASARRHKHGFALLFLDLDRFKIINDTIGHEAGDLLLQVIAERLKSTVRNNDMVARLGGDEFVILVTDVQKTESVAVLAQKILENILKVIILNGQEIYITTSIGISLYPYDGQNMQTLMKNADLALYRAKDQGRNNYQFYTLEMTTRALQKMALQNALAHALVKNEFTLHYQPKMNLKTRKITGIEAFLRWKSNEYNAITPGEIISIAEDSGLIIPVSEWILKTACKQLKAWHALGYTSLTMAINCSGRQFKQATFVEDLLQIITQSGVSAHSLEIELTESAVMEDAENTLRVLFALKDIGVKIVIDDFGTGYWSLNNLRRLSVHKIKIDKTFVKQLAVDDISAGITNAIIAMANKLNIMTIAEGVETREQYDYLEKEGCTEIQGYYLTQPVSAQAMTQFLHHPVPDAEVVKEDGVTS